MSIFSRLMQFVQVHGVSYVGSSGMRGVRRGARLRRGGEEMRARYLEAMEPRILMTTLFGGETFTYTDARGNSIKAQLNGSVVAELVAAVQQGGVNEVPGEGSLIFGNIAGTISGGPRNGTVIGRGSLPVTGAGNGTPITPTHTPFNGTVSGATTTLTTAQINITGVAASATGQIFAFNVYDLDSNGNVAMSTNATGSTLWTIQILKLNGTSNSVTEVFSTDSETTSSPTQLVPYFSTAASVTGAAFNPADNLLYFTIRTDNKPQTGNEVITDTLWRWDPANPAQAPNSVGNLFDYPRQSDGLAQMDPTALTFSSNGVGGNVTLWVAESPNKNATDTTFLAPRLLSFPVSGSSIAVTSFSQAVNVFEGFGSNRKPAAVPATATGVTGATIIGLATLPTSIEEGGSNFLFAAVRNGSSSHMVRFDLTSIATIQGETQPSIEGTNWGNTFLGNSANGRGFTDGQTLSGLTFDPLLLDPINGTIGTFLSVDNGTVNLDFVNDRLHVTAGDVYAVNTTQADISSSITFQGFATGNNGVGNSVLYTGTSGVAGAPANSGVGLLGFLGQVPTPPQATGNNPQTFGNQPFLTGAMDRSIGVLSQYSADTTDPTALGGPTNKLFAGLTVGQTLEQTLDPTQPLLSQVLATGGGFSTIIGLAIQNTGNMAVLNASAFSPGSPAADRLSFVDKTTGHLKGTTYAITLSNGTVLANAEAFAYGDPGLSGFDSLYAVYDLGDGNGPTVGTITIPGSGTRATFNPIHTLGLGVHGHVFALAFGPPPTVANAQGGTPTREDVFIVADPNFSDTDTHEILYRVDVSGTSGTNPNYLHITSGTAPVFNGTGAVIVNGGVGVVSTVSTSNGGQVLLPLQVGSMAYDGSGRLVVQDKLSGRLLDLSTAPGIIVNDPSNPAGTTLVAPAGLVFASIPGTVNPTVGAIAFDNTAQNFYAVDNETGTLAFRAPTANSTSSTASSILMILKNFQQPTAQATTLGKFMFDGTVTGRVYVSGSMDTFYAGYLVTGNSATASDLIAGVQGTGSWITPVTLVGNSSGEDNSTTENNFHNNFYVGGDIRNILSLTNIGPAGSSNSNALAVEIMAVGKVGNVDALGTFFGTVRAENQSFVPSILDNPSLSGLGIVGTDGTSFEAQQQIQQYNRGINYTNASDSTFSTGFGLGFIMDVPNTSARGAFAPFANASFDTAQYLGTIGNSVSGQPDVIHLKGEVEAIPASGNNAFTAVQRVNYYGVALLAGQTIDVQVQPGLDGSGLLSSNPTQMAIFDPDGREIATDYSQIDKNQARGRVVEFTADRPGVYRIAVQTLPDATTAGDFVFAGTTAEEQVNAIFDLTIKGVGTPVGNMAIGAVSGRGGIILPGSFSVTTIVNTSIQADTGDIGIIEAGRGPNATQSIWAQSSTYSIGNGPTPAQGYVVSNGSEDVLVGHGNLRAMVAGAIGDIFIDTGSGLTFVSAVPDLFVNGTVGLLQTSTGSQMLAVSFATPASGDIQMIDAGGELEGLYRTNQSIGVIRAGSVQTPVANDPFPTEFHVDADRTGADGIIDLIDVSGNWGNSSGTGTVFTDGGAPIVTGPGGNIRFMNVAGTVQQDRFFSSNGNVTNSRGQIVHQPGPVTYTDDSGAQVTITPGTVPPANTTSTATTAGTITTLAYGVRGGGGQVMLEISANSGISISATGGHEVEIGSIITGGAGAALSFSTSGVPTFSTSGSSNTSNDVRITSPDNTPVTAFHIVNGSGGTIDTLLNTSGGDIVNVTAGDIGSITSSGNIGSTHSTTGAALNGLTVVSNTFPFVDQRKGITASNIGSISANKSIGNISASVIGTITANADNQDDPGVFEGINGPIVSNGTITVTVNGVATAIGVSITSVNIGDGIASGGSGAMADAGIFATGAILTIRGTNADIRGPVVSTGSVSGGSFGIGTITLTNGSIVNTDIFNGSQYNWASVFDASNKAAPTSGTDIDHPVYGIRLINISGNGGIIGTEIMAQSIGTITVGSGGFGLFKSAIFGTNAGTIANISIGGYGIRDTFITDARVQNISATGSGAPEALTLFPDSVRQSQFSVVNSLDGHQVNALTDLDVYMFGDGEVQGPSPEGLITGALELVTARGEDALGTISAYDINGSQFNFPRAIGPINVRNNVYASLWVSGGVQSVTIAGDAVDMDLTIAGPIGPVLIKGNVISGTGGPLAVISQISAKGTNGNITSVTVNGDFGGDLLAEGKVGNVTFGSAGKSGNPSTGNFTGTVTLGGKQNSPSTIGSLKFFGSIIGGTIIINGNAGTIDVAQDFGGLAQDLTVHGNVSTLLVGSDPAVNGSVLGALLTIDGNLGTGTITGILSGQLVVTGNISNLAINKDTQTAGTDLLTGSLAVGGTLSTLTVQGGISGVVQVNSLTNLTVTGNVSGDVVSANGGLSVAITGSLLAGGCITSTFGTITKLAITNGNLDGNVTANDGGVTSITLTGATSSIGSTATIAARSLGSVVVPASIDGAFIVTNAITSIQAGTMSSTATITAGSLGTLKTTGDMLGSITTLGTTGNAAITVGRNMGGNSSYGGPLTVTVGGSMLAGSTLASTSNLTSLAIKGGLSGHVIVDGAIGAITAGTMSGATITSGMGIGTITITGNVTNSLVNAGLARGNDHLFGTGDQGELPRMADIGAISVGSLVNTIIAAGGNITTFKSTANSSSSSVSSGLVLGGAEIQAVLNDASPLSDQTRLNAARMDSTLFHGNITTANVGKTGGTSSTMINSALTAGVSPGPGGTFGVTDRGVYQSLTGGISTIKTLAATASADSFILAASPILKSPATVVTYTLDSGPNSILQSDPLTGNATAIVLPGNVPFNFTSSNGTLTITLSGPVGSQIALYDDPTTTDRLDTMVISNVGTSSTPLIVTVTEKAAGLNNRFDIGRVITADNTILTSFIANGSSNGVDIVGDVNGGPAIWIDSDMTTFAVRNLPGASAWSGQIGGNVTTFIANQLGSGQMRVGGRIATLNVASSVGNPLLQQLGSDPAAAITQIAIDPNSNNAFSTNGNNLVGVDIFSGNITSTSTIQTVLSNQQLTVNGIAFDGSGNLYGVATLNNQNPLTLVGSTSTTGDQLSSLAVDSTGRIFAIDSQSGTANLVQIDPTTGAETVLGPVKDARQNTYTGNIRALAFDNQDRLLALVNDANGSAAGNGGGDALALISTTVSQGSDGLPFVRISSPGANGGALQPVTISSTLTYDALAVNSSGQIFAIRNDGVNDSLDRLTINGSGGSTSVTRFSFPGNVLTPGSVSTQITGMGFDENGNLIGYSAGNLVSVNTSTPSSSSQLTASAVVNPNFVGFALGRSGSAFKAYGITTNGTTGGNLYVSPGVVPTLGVINTATGVMSELLPLTQDPTGHALASPVVSIAVTSGGNVFALTANNQLAEYDAMGNLIGGAPLGVIQDSAGVQLHLTRITFDNLGRLVGINDNANDLVVINPVAQIINGVHVLAANAVTGVGTVPASDLTSLAFSTISGTFVSYSQSTGNFVSILGTSQGAIGGLTANSLGNVTLGVNFGGAIYATGNGTGNAIDSVKISGVGNVTGNFTGSISADGSIGSVTDTGANFGGTVYSRVDVTSMTITNGNVSASGTIAADGKLTTFTMSGGNFSGSIQAVHAGSITINGSALAGSQIAVRFDLASLTITGQSAGAISVGNDLSRGSITTLKINGLEAATGSVFIGGDATTVTLGGGADNGSTFLTTEGINSLTVGGTLAGSLAVRRNVGTVVLAAANVGLLDIGGSLSNLTVNGNMTQSLVSVGTWIGFDGVFNTADDVIYGGTITTAKVNGVFTDSVIAAGVLPSITASVRANNLPADLHAYTGNTTAGAALSLVNSAEVGGIAMSTIGTISFSKPVVSSNAFLTGNAGLMSIVAAANGLGKVTATGNLHQVSFKNPPGAPQVVQSSLSSDNTTFTIVFSEPLDTATLNSSTIQVVNSVTHLPIVDATFSYTTQLAPDGSTQGVLNITSPSKFAGSAVTVTLQGGPNAPTITDMTGLRSALFDYDQNGIPNPGGNPFGATITTQTFSFVVTLPSSGPPANDNFANAVTLSPSIPTSVTGTNIHATSELGEPVHDGVGAGNSVWWSWTPTASGPVQIDTIGSNFDTVLAVYTGSAVNALTLVAADDQSGGNNTSLVNFVATAGTTYQIAVDGWYLAANPTGSIVLTVS